MVIGMAHFAANVGCDLIAEGIETANELTALKLLGVAFGQGYLLGKPASVDAARSAMPAAAGTAARAGRPRRSAAATPVVVAAATLPRRQSHASRARG